jgi:murein DD-endopeptidase MepM/ murein hydrolase activator NlpD
LFGISFVRIFTIQSSKGLLREYSNPFLISTKLKSIRAILAFFVPFRAIGALSARQSLRIEAFTLVASSLLFLAFLGNGSRGPIPLFNALTKGPITETSAYREAGPSQSQLADMNSISGFSTGYGLLQRPNDPSSVLIQESYILALSPIDNDYLDTMARGVSLVDEYIVREGDSLSRIAFDYGVSVESIIWLNEIIDIDSLSLGTVLKIPPVSGVVHTIEFGDTVESLANTYGAEGEKIRAFNGLRGDGPLLVGGEIIIPDGLLPPASGDEESTISRNFSYLPVLGDYYQAPARGLITQGIHGRNAVDLANGCGTPIYAAAEGVVRIANGDIWNGGYGKYVAIGHPNGTETLYAHTQKLFVKTGDVVSKGQIIAEIGSTGKVFGVTGCHVHFEVNGAQNPLAKY